MNKNEFYELILLLKSVYGEDSYPSPVIKIWYAELGHVNKSRLSKAFNRVIANSPNPRYAPSLEKVEKALTFIREDDHQKEKKEWKDNCLSAQDVSDFFKELKNNAIVNSHED